MKNYFDTTAPGVGRISLLLLQIIFRSTEGREMQRTLKITGRNGLPHEEYIVRLEKLGFVLSEADKVDLHLYAFDGTGKKDWQTQSQLKSCVDGIKNVADKSQLYFTLGNIAQRYMAKEYPLTSVMRAGRVVLPGPILLKPVGSLAFGGNGIQVVTKGDRPRLERQWKYVACEYIQDLLLFEKKKFHLRVYLFVSTWGKWQLVPKYRIIPAKLPYQEGDWTNKDIHDTHLDSAEKDYFFCPDGDLYLPETDEQIQLVCAELAKHIHATSFKESKSGYEMLGLDFLVRKDGSVVLLEVNNNAGIKCVENWSEFKAQVMEMEIGFVKEYFTVIDIRGERDVNYSRKDSIRSAGNANHKG